MTNPTPTPTPTPVGPTVLKPVTDASWPVINRLHELLAAGWSDDVVQNTLGAWQQQVEAVEAAIVASQQNQAVT